MIPLAACDTGPEPAFGSVSVLLTEAPGDLVAQRGHARSVLVLGVVGEQGCRREEDLLFHRGGADFVLTLGAQCPRGAGLPALVALGADRIHRSAAPGHGEFHRHARYAFTVPVHNPHNWRLREQGSRWARLTVSSHRFQRRRLRRHGHARLVVHLAHRRADHRLAPLLTCDPAGSVHRRAQRAAVR
jgi:hypothetical protein